MILVRPVLVEEKAILADGHLARQMLIAFGVRFSETGHDE
jgi:hypothetical protein